MALSNAERQRRYRQRAARALHASKAPAAMAIPTALLAMLRRDHSVEDSIGQAAVATLVGYLLVTLGLNDANADAPPEAAIIAALGGREYVSALLRWTRAKAAVGLDSPVT